MTVYILEMNGNTLRVSNSSFCGTLQNVATAVSKIRAPHAGAKAWP